MDRFVRRLSRPLRAPPLLVGTDDASRVEPPPKRLKVEGRPASGGVDLPPDSDSDDGAGDDEGQAADKATPRLAQEDSVDDLELGREDSPRVGEHETAIESSLPPVRVDQDAIEEYEVARASQADEGDAASRIDSRRWIRGRSSIYVDAFHLALETVLQDEAHLFDDKEMAVFTAWRSLDYEAQYLYVRLFLRKTSAWHRAGRLGYYSDISDPEKAIGALQRRRDLPGGDDAPAPSPLSDVPLQDWSLGSSFAFADSSGECISTVEEAVTLLGLEELKVLAKEARVQGKNKSDLQSALARVSARQTSLASLGLRRSSTEGSTGSTGSTGSGRESETDPGPSDKSRRGHFLSKILAVTGPCIRVAPAVFKLFERVHLVFYRSTEWTEKSLTTIILAKISRRTFPEYVVCRSSNLFASRRHLLEFEQAMRMEYEVDRALERGPPGEAGFQRVLDVFDGVAARWRALLREEQRKEEHMYESDEGGYLRRFNAAHAYTRVAHKAAHAYGRLRRYLQEHRLLAELLAQTLFQMARRGGWYQRKALLEEHYMPEADPDPEIADLERRKKHWRRIAVATCEQGLEDRDCHLIYHYDLQKRLVKLEKRLKVPRRLQHTFGHVRLHAPEEHTVEGIQWKRECEPASRTGRGSSTKTLWVDENEGGGECSVEAMCLSHYRARGWKGYHAEGGIVRTLFAYLFFDVLFVYIPNVFQTAYQTCPLDLHTDAFFPTRASQINRRLAEIANGAAEDILRRVHGGQSEHRTCVVGLDWDFALEDLAELVRCFRGEALAAVCKVMAQEYRQRGGGIPDLLLWRTQPEPEVLFVEVKSANDRLSDTQRLWIHVLTGAGVRVALCSAVAKEVRVT